MDSLATKQDSLFEEFLATLTYPCSPQPDPHEFLIKKYSLPFSIPYPAKMTA